MTKTTLPGFLVWCVLMGVESTFDTDLTYIGMLFLFAALVIVPLGLELTAQLEKGTEPTETERIARASRFPAALAVAASFVVKAGPLAGGLAAIWFAFCAILGVAGLSRIFCGGLRELDRACPAIAFLSLPVGGAWLIASRMGQTPLGFHEPIVLLTAVHFHYAGFAAAMLVRPTARILAPRESRRRGARIFRVISFGVLAGPAVLAVAFLFEPQWKLFAAGWLALSELGLAISFLAALRGVRVDGAKFLIGLAAVSVVFSMVYAMIWAVGEYPLHPLVGIPTMAVIHGGVNALGFAFCGLAGWTSSLREEREGASQQV